MERFIYAFSKEDRDYLLEHGFTLLTSDEVHERYMFENNLQYNFSANETDGRKIVFSNTMSF